MAAALQVRGGLFRGRLFPCIHFYGEVAAALLVRGELFGGRGPKAEGRGSGPISEPAQEPFLAAAAHLQTCFLKFPNGL